MTTVFSLLSQVCGLSHREVAGFLGTRIDTVKSWSSGRNRAPVRVLDDLAGLAARIDKAADEALAEIEVLTEIAVRETGAEPADIELGIATDDHEAQTLGWPCVGAHRAVLALVVARGMGEARRFKVVPRGTTVATAAAAEAHHARAPEL